MCSPLNLRFVVAHGHYQDLIPAPYLRLSLQLGFVLLCVQLGFLHVVETQPPIIPELSYNFSCWEGLAIILPHFGSGATVEPHYNQLFSGVPG